MTITPRIFGACAPRSPHDCLVARIALKHMMALFHDDRDFELIAEVKPRLKLFPLA